LNHLQICICKEQKNTQKMEQLTPIVKQIGIIVVSVLIANQIQRAIDKARTSAPEIKP
jgi:hypothetical protein